MQKGLVFALALASIACGGMVRAQDAPAVRPECTVGDVQSRLKCISVKLGELVEEIDKLKRLEHPQQSIKMCGVLSPGNELKDLVAMPVESKYTDCIDLAKRFPPFERYSTNRAQFFCFHDGGLQDGPILSEKIPRSEIRFPMPGCGW